MAEIAAGSSRDTIFHAHSVRGASTSKAANMGITSNDILKAAWSQCFIISQPMTHPMGERCSYHRTLGFSYKQRIDM